MTKRTHEREQFLADVLTTAVEGGIQYWIDTVDEYRHKGLAPRDYFAVITFENPKDDGPSRLTERITIDVVAKGIGILDKDQAFHFGYFNEFWKANRTNGNEGDFDASVADCIVQCGLLGEVVFG